ncbi:hypothetical protein H9Q69_010760 [Fusarium xylarioides]|uniref:Uncharacterized protein n=1 Tax=Fusarium xylarioides TaxID=221167 RepID=A0A9P7HTB2_9HYPO|nr:hypothetical protein H9Q70_012703 [Fusarium xylarioides]KAG5761524.1 hypothetical protein H9Q72_010383 [Fusarium xylarioides]KAG5771797.1 hypothetical protein H9Q73_012713 [Fusarium xylarioides]KAG5790196.1 hypothetical protein H9Q69_010760 [Fusarium xylarioides]KAG5805314.1 hypothetical protein H9Q71_010098 [Fusarium xylarioides]
MPTPEDFLSCESSSSEEEEHEGEEDYEEEVEYVEVNKRFYPSNVAILQDTANDELIKFNPEKQVSFLGARLEATGPIVPAGDIIVIRLATGFLKDRLLARSAWALYFGPQSQFNTYRGYDGISRDVPSETENLLEVIEYVEDIQRFVDDINMFIIATDDASLVELATEELRIMARDEDFRERGSGQPREYYELWSAIDRQAHGYRHDEGPQYRFWLIPEEMNQEARTLMDCKLNPDDHEEEDLWV